MGQDGRGQEECHHGGSSPDHGEEEDKAFFKSLDHGN